MKYILHAYTTEKEKISLLVNEEERDVVVEKMKNNGCTDIEIIEDISALHTGKKIYNISVYTKTTNKILTKKIEAFSEVDAQKEIQKLGYILADSSKNIIQKEIGYESKIENNSISTEENREQKSNAIPKSIHILLEKLHTLSQIDIQYISTENNEKIQKIQKILQQVNNIDISQENTILEHVLPKIESIERDIYTQKKAKQKYNIIGNTNKKTSLHNLVLDPQKISNISHQKISTTSIENIIDTGDISYTNNSVDTKYTTDILYYRSARNISTYKKLKNEYVYSIFHGVCTCNVGKIREYIQKYTTISTKIDIEKQNIYPNVQSSIYTLGNLIENILFILLYISTLVYIGVTYHIFSTPISPTSPLLSPITQKIDIYIPFIILTLSMIILFLRYKNIYTRLCIFTIFATIIGLFLS